MDSDWACCETLDLNSPRCPVYKMRIKGGPDSSVHGEDWRRLIRTAWLAEGPRSVNVGYCRYPRCYSRLPESSIDVIETGFRGKGGIC